MVLAVLAALVVVAAAVVVPLALRDDDDRAPTASAGVDGGVDTSNLDLVAEYEDLELDHVDEDVDYRQSPPVGGPHWGEWLECGVYDQPVPDENAVHDLEHGSVWITYRDDLVDDDGVEGLAGVLPANGILSPYPDQDAPVVITAWGRQLELVGPDDPRIPLFIDAYGAGETAPEPWASCAGGTADPGGEVV